MRKKIVSACLAGMQCRYDQKHCRDQVIQELVEQGEAVTICPEQLGGLATPRNPAEIIGGDGMDVLAGKAKVIDNQGNDVTKQYIDGAYHTLKIAQSIGAKEAILKEKSPSCGSTWIYNGEFTGVKEPGQGITAALLRKHGITVRSEQVLDEQDRL